MTYDCKNSSTQGPKGSEWEPCLREERLGLCGVRTGWVMCTDSGTRLPGPCHLWDLRQLLAFPVSASSSGKWRQDESPVPRVAVTTKWVGCVTRSESAVSIWCVVSAEALNLLSVNPWEPLVELHWPLISDFSLENCQGALAILSARLGEEVYCKNTLLLKLALNEGHGLLSWGRGWPEAPAVLSSTFPWLASLSRHLSLSA